MDTLFTPSFPLLLIKSALIFLVIAIVGWVSLPIERLRVKLGNRFVSDVLQLSTGLVVISLSSFYGLLLNLTGVESAVILILFVFTRGTILWCRKQNKKEFKFIFPAPRTMLLVASIALLYLVPLASSFSSGIYARGGGDGQIYGSFSSWLTDHRFRDEILPSETVPPAAYAEVNSLTVGYQRFLGKYESFPIPNFYILSPYMSLLPGSYAETYTATVAIYFALTMAGFAIFLSTLFKIPEREGTLLGFGIALSPISLYIPASNALGLMLGLTLLFTLLTSYLRLIDSATLPLPWRTPLWPILWLAGGGLFVYYPHLFVFGGALMIVMVTSLRGTKGFISLMPIIGWNLLGVALLANVMLYFHFYTVILGATFSRDYGTSTLSWLDIMAVQSGFFDFASLAGATIKERVIYHIVGTGVLVVLAFAAGIAVWNAPHKPRRVALAFIAIFTFMLATYTLKESGPGFQVYRFTEIFHPLLLGMALIGLGQSIASHRLFVRLASGLTLLALLVTLMAGNVRAWSDLLASPPAWNCDIRRGDDLVLLEQTVPLLSNGRRPVYFFGRGFGVEQSLVTYLLRESRLLMGQGYSYVSAGENFSLWDKKFLDDSLLLVNKGDDIIYDKRPDQAVAMASSDRTDLYDPRNASFASLVGDAWNSAQRAAPGTYRYLKGAVGALAIWSPTTDIITVQVTAWSDQDNTRLILTTSTGEQLANTPIPRWSGGDTPPGTITVQMPVQKGANVLLIKPTGTQTAKPVPWPLVFRIDITSNLAGIDISQSY